MGEIQQRFSKVKQNFSKTASISYHSGVD